MTGSLRLRLEALPRPARFLLAGGAAAGINWLVRFPLSTVMPFLPAVLVAAAIGMLVGFVLYRGFVFPRSPRPMILQIRDFAAVNAVTSLAVAAFSVLGLALLGSVVARHALAEAVAHAAAIGAGAALNYVGHGLVTFGRAGPSTGAVSRLMARGHDVRRALPGPAHPWRQMPSSPPRVAAQGRDPRRRRREPRWARPGHLPESRPEPVPHGACAGLPATNSQQLVSRGEVSTKRVELSHATRP